MAEMDGGTEWGALARYERALATVRDFGERSLALSVTLVLDAGDGVTDAMIEWETGENPVLTAGEQAYLVTDELLEGVLPIPVKPPAPVLPESMHAHPERDEVMAPLGALANLGLAVLELARTFGGRTVATADFATADGSPITIAAREGEPLLLGIGDAQYELPVPPAAA